MFSGCRAHVFRHTRRKRDTTAAAVYRSDPKLDQPAGRDLIIGVAAEVAEHHHQKQIAVIEVAFAYPRPDL